MSVASSLTNRKAEAIPRFTGPMVTWPSSDFRPICIFE
jgi:hypothetical protein